jgi:hypothetical protein
MNVTFNAERHTYTNSEGKGLQGITSLLSKHLFPKKYSAVPEKTLAQAAERGKSIHFALQCFNDDRFVLNEELIEKWEKFRAENGIVTLKSEYLVSDGINFATQIDLVGMVDDFDALFDFKTTYNVDKKYLSWQLSICDYLKRKTDGIGADKLFGIHIDKEYNFTLIEVGRISDHKIEDLFRAELDGKIYSDVEIANIDTNALMLLESTYNDLKSQLDDLEEKRTALMQLVREQMIASGIKSFDVGDTKFTNVEDTVSQTFDSKKFKADHPEMADLYTKTTNKKGFLKITTKK